LSLSVGGILDLLGALPGLLNIAFETKDAILFGLIWVFRLARYAPGLTGQRRAIGNAWHSLLSMLLLLQRRPHRLIQHRISHRAGSQPEVFGSIRPRYGGES
jgi:hypothetical protein